MNRFGKSAVREPLLQADKKRTFNRLFRMYCGQLLRRHFHSVTATGSFGIGPGEPAIYMMNHCSWWDGLLAYYATQACSRADHFMMMDARQLSAFSFFRKLGAFSIDSGSVSSIVASLNYAGELLRQGKSVWLYPQGTIRHLEERPIRFRSGIGVLLRRNPSAAVVPVTVYYSVSGHQKLIADLRIGQAVRTAWSLYDRKQIASMLEQIMTEQLDDHRNRIIGRSGTGSFPVDVVSLLPPGSSTSEQFRTFSKGVEAWKSFFGLR